MKRLNNKKISHCERSEAISFYKRIASGFALAMTLLILCLGFGILPSYADTTFNTDPMYIGVGARPLGMGKAYVAVAEDSDTIFINPAGLGRFRAPKITSMYSNLMGDVNYMVLAGTLPLEIGSLGVGYIGSKVDNIWILGSDAINTTHNPVPTSYGAANNNVMFVSYGFPLEKFVKFGKNIYVGANIKYFDQGASGGTSGESVAGNGRGMDVDLGILYTPSTWLSLGLNQQNLLPSGLGGTMVYKSGVEEAIPTVTKAGAKLILLGSKDTALYESPLLFDNPVKVNMAADIDLYPQAQKFSSPRIGFEIMPNDIVALRFGLDQDPTPVTVDPSQGRNFTYGVGVKYQGIGFDYAYHPYGGMSENATHFFSISYTGKDRVEEGINYISIVKPRDKLITRKDYVKVAGIVLSDVDSVQINGVQVPLEIVGDTKAFKAKIDLNTVGKKLVIIEALDRDGVVLEVQKRRILRLSSFTDVNDDYWAADAIEYAATAGLVEGYPDNTFQPDRVLSRAELATLLVRTSGEEIKSVLEKKIFPDLPASHWASRYIKVANELGLVVGYPDKTFKPNKSINRAEGVSVATRFDGEKDSIPAEEPYADIARSHWAAGAIDAAKEKGLLDYLSSERFEPSQGLTRSEAVEILVKTDFGKEKIDALLNWNKGFSVKSMVNLKSTRDSSKEE